MNPRVISVIANDDYTLTLTFTNGEIKVYDMNPVLDFGVFKELKDKSYFRQVFAFNGTIQWPNEQDICPDTLYLDSKTIERRISA